MSSMIEYPVLSRALGIKAHDKVIGANSQQLRVKILQQIPGDPRKTGQLHGTLNLPVGKELKYLLTLEQMMV